MKKTLNLIVMSTIFLILILFSELIYGRNFSKLISYTSFKVAKIVANLSGSQKAIDVITLGARVNISLTRNRDGLDAFLLKKVDTNHEQDTVFWGNPYKINLKDEVLKDQIRKYILNFPVEILLTDKYDYSRVFYDLAILSFKNGGEYLFPNLMKTAINLDPDQSIYYMELGNFHYKYDEINEARNVLYLCRLLTPNYILCDDISRRVNNKDYHLNIGFLQDDIVKSYGFPEEFK